MRKLIPLTIIWSLFSVAAFLLAKLYLADVYFKKSEDFLNEDNTTKSLLYIDKSVKLNQFEPAYFRERAKINTVLLVDTKDKEGIKESILDDLQTAKDKNSNNLVIIRNSVPIYYLLAIKDFNEMGDNNKDEDYLEIAKNFYSGVKRSYWNDVGVISLVAKYEKKLELDYEYKESLERVKILRPDLIDWYESFK